MSSRTMKKNRKDRSLLHKILLVLITAAAIVYFMPRDAKFNYTYDINKPWRYGQLIATFKFPVYKNDSVVKQERDSIMRFYQPYYQIDENVYSGLINQLKAKSASSSKNANVKEHLQRASLVLDTIYTDGIIDVEEYNNMTDRKISSIMVINGNVAVPKQLKDIYTTRTAYEHLIRLDTSRQYRFLMQDLNIIDYIQPNLKIDKKKSEASEKYLLSSISDASGVVQSGEKIIDRGEIVTPKIYNILNSLKKESEQHSDSNLIPYMLFGQIASVLVLLTILIIYLSLFRSDYLDNLRSSILPFSLVAFFSIMASLMVSNNFMNVFTLPCAMLPIIIRVFMDSRTAFTTHAITVLIISLTIPDSFVFIFLQLTTGMIAIQNLRELSQRSQIIRTAFFITVTYLVMYTSFELIHENDIMKINRNMYLYFFINGILLMFTYPLLWMLEKMFGFTSDVTLVELSNTNNELLQRMSEIAPGTFQHSLQVANLASEVAKRINAKSQLVRTGALYHDIGKTERPAYFTENQAGINPHKRLTPVKSAEVIIAHVKNGLALAEKYNLPQTIRNFISTHHGRGKAKYFYITYKNEHPDEDIDEELFTYPGPNPTTKEEAILMMTDSVEAASRSLKEYNEESISNLVDRIIDSQVADGAFKECNITFKEIAIAKSVLKEKLKTIYHTRITYPELSPNKDNEEKTQTTEETNSN